MYKEKPLPSWWFKKISESGDLINLNWTTGRFGIEIEIELDIFSSDISDSLDYFPRNEWERVNEGLSLIHI